MAKKVIEPDIVPEEMEIKEVKPKAKKEVPMTDKDIADAVNYLFEIVTNEMNRRKKSGERWRQLVRISSNLFVAKQGVRLFATGGHYSRVANG
jgi:CRP-like cAMP-binding protein